jgi:uncharacterized protein YjeT (DUF2065 family)
MMKMQIVIKSLGIVLALIAVIYMLRPDIAKKIMIFFQKGRRIYFDGIINLSLAVIFFAGANQCRYSWVILVCGIIFLAEALMIFGLGSKKANVILDLGLEQSDELYRFFGLLIGSMGVIIVFST